MKATENKGAGILHQILPPHLEDAGLVDCAFLPYSINEAFFKAATPARHDSPAEAPVRRDAPVVTPFKGEVSTETRVRRDTTPVADDSSTGLSDAISAPV
ncbi:hypothetical protein ACFX2I_030583 [Malus domestica]